MWNTSPFHHNSQFTPKNGLFVLELYSSVEAKTVKISKQQPYSMHFIILQNIETSLGKILDIKLNLPYWAIWVLVGKPPCMTVLCSDLTGPCI